MTKRINAFLVCCFCVSACAADASSTSTTRDTESAPLPPLPPAATGSNPPPSPSPASNAITKEPEQLSQKDDVVDPAVLVWGFEPASADCNGWPTQGADAIRASPARSGNYSCKVCATSAAATETGFEISRDLGVLPVGSYVMSAWVRKRVQTAAPTQAVARVEAGATIAIAPTIAIRDAWDELHVPFEVTTAGEKVRVSIGAPAADIDRCLFVDDVIVRKND